MVAERWRSWLAVPVWAWLLVPPTEGFYAWEGNGELFREALEAFLDMTTEEDLDFAGVALDLEPPIQQTREFADNPSVLVDPPNPNPDLNPARHCTAVDVYTALIDDAQRAGLTITAAAWPTVLDDLVDGRIAFQDGLNVVTAPPSGWDSLYFMAYSSELAPFFGDPGSGYVASYARSARESFGEVGQISLGVASVSPYDDLENLVRDVRVLATVLQARALVIDVTTVTSSPSMTRCPRPVNPSDDRSSSAPPWSSSSTTASGATRWERWRPRWAPVPECSCTTSVPRRS